MKHTKVLFSLLLTLLLLASPALAIELEAGTGTDFYVQDTANILSSDTAAQIEAYNETLETQCSEAQLVVVTVSYLDEGSDVAALQLMNDWGVGSAQDSNGMLLLLVANEYRGWLATGDGIDEVFTDDMAEKYLNEYFWDYIDRDQFDEGVQSLTSELYNWYLDYYSVSADNATTETQSGIPFEPVPDREYYEEPLRGGNGMNILTLLIIVVIVWLLVSSSRYNRMRGWGYGGGFWPIFWFGGHRMYRDWHRRNPGPQPPRGPHGRGPGGPGSFGGGPRSGGSSNFHHSSRPSAPRGNGFGGHGGGGGGRPGGFGGGPRGGGGGGHGGGGGGGRR